MLKTGDQVLIHQHPFKFYNPQTYIPSLIRLFCKTRYNHCGVIVFNWGVPVLNEAKASGVVSTPLDFALNGKEIMIRRPKAEVIEKDYAIAANAYLGRTPYDFFVLFVVQPIYILTGHWIGKTGPSSKGAQVCSEYNGNCALMDQAYKISPKDLRDSTLFETIHVGFFNIKQKL